MNPRDNHPRCVLLYAALAVLIASWLTVAACGQEWDWSPSAPHHAAIVGVQAGQNAGSGVYVALGERGGVLTVAHIVNASKTATVTWSDGTTSNGKAHYDKYGHDVGIVVVTHPTIKPLVLADADPVPGSRVEFVTRGGPEHRLRSFWSAFEGERQLVNGSDALYTVAVSPGDSGGAILDSSSRVVGIVSAGRTRTINGEGWPVYRGSVSAPRGPIRAFLQRALCPPGGCPPGGGAPPRRRGPILEWERGGQIEFYPPRRPDPPPVLPGPGLEPPLDPPLVPIQPPGVDQGHVDAINGRLDKLEEMIAVIPAGRTGDTGQQGGQGIQGKAGRNGVSPTIDLDALAEKVAAKLPPMYFQAKNPDGSEAGPPVEKRLGDTVGIRTLWVPRPSGVASE